MIENVLISSPKRIDRKYFYIKIKIYHRMIKQIFVNLAVKDVESSQAFYTALGFSINPQFSDDTGKCMVWNESIFLMLLSHSKFSTFVTKPIADTGSNIAGIFSMSTESVDEVNSIMENGLKAGGIEPNEMRDGFMIQRTIEDLDGHTWEFFYMDMSKLPAGNT